MGVAEYGFQRCKRLTDRLDGGLGGWRSCGLCARRRHLRQLRRAQRRGTQGGQNAADAAGRVRTA